MPRYTVSRSGADCKSVVTDSGGATPSLGTLAQKSVDRSEERQSLLRDITLGPSRTRENNESSSQDFMPF